MALRMTEEEYAAWKKRKALTPYEEVKARLGRQDDEGKRSKYGNRRTEAYGLKFDSMHEANVYQELMLRVKAGELKVVLRQVPFDLPGGIRYFADFVAIRPDNSIEGVYDAKSEITKKNRVYINKKKQLMALYGIEIVEK